MLKRLVQTKRENNFILIDLSDSKGRESNNNDEYSSNNNNNNNTTRGEFSLDDKSIVSQILNQINLANPEESDFIEAINSRCIIWVYDQVDRNPQTIEKLI